MNSISKRNSVPFIKKFMKTLSIFGILPWYNFDKNRMVHKNIFKCYSSILALLLVCLSIGCLRARLSKVYGNTISTKTVIEVLIEFVVLSTVIVSVLGASFWNMRPWEHLITQYIRRTTSASSMSVDHVFIVRYAQIIFFIGNIYFLSLWMIPFFLLKTGYYMVPYYFISHFLDYYSFLIGFAISIVTGLVRFEYKCMNKFLSECSIENLRVDEPFQKIRRLYLKTDKIVQIFNRLFGFPLLFLCSTLVIKVLNSLVLASSFTRFAYFGQIGIPVTNVLALLRSGIWLSAIIFCCDSVGRETDELLTNCYRLEQALPLTTKALKELERLASLIKNRRPKLTAADFFEIRRSTLLSLLGTTTTYFIVALQFNTF